MNGFVGKKSAALFLLFPLLSAMNAFSLDAAADSITQSLGRGDLRSAYRGILSEKDGSKIASVFYQESKRGLTDPVLKSRMEKVAEAFERRLRREMNPLTFAAYRKFASDTGLGEGDRMRFIIPMVEGESGLRPLQKDTLKSFLKALLATGISAKMKAGLLVQATRSISVGLDGKELLPFFRSPDSTIRKAALNGLVRVVRRNRDRGDAEPNRAVFDSIKGNAAYVPDRFDVLVLAAIGEDFSRDYLLSRCGKDAAKLAAVIKHDPCLKHPGLTYAALAFPKTTPQGMATREALRYGLKDPDWVAGQIASGSFNDPAKAEELRKVMATQTTASR